MTDAQRIPASELAKAIIPPWTPELEREMARAGQSESHEHYTDGCVHDAVEHWNRVAKAMYLVIAQHGGAKAEPLAGGLETKARKRNA